MTENTVKNSIIKNVMHDRGRNVVLSFGKCCAILWFENVKPLVVCFVTPSYAIEKCFFLLGFAIE